MKIWLVVSGGQSGADLAGNAFAKDAGIPTAIFSFQDFKPTREEDFSLYESFPRIPLDLRGSYISKLAHRTEFNVKISDATVIFVDKVLSLKVGSGSRLTFDMCKKHQKPRKVIFLEEREDHVLDLQLWLQSETPAILNVAGSRTCVIGEVKEILKEAFRRAFQRSSEVGRAERSF